VPVPAESALPEPVAAEAIERATGEAEAAGIGGPALTPWILARVAELTDGASIRANIALIVNDALAAGQLASRLPAHGPGHLPRRPQSRVTDIAGP
jgi:pseudouridine-5'-phosphate glycosidase